MGKLIEGKFGENSTTPPAPVKTELSRLLPRTQTAIESLTPDELRVLSDRLRGVTQPAPLKFPQKQ